MKIPDLNQQIERNELIAQIRAIRSCYPAHSSDEGVDWEGFTVDNLKRIYEWWQEASERRTNEKHRTDQ